jgi:hypothetical protein
MEGHGWIKSKTAVVVARQNNVLFSVLAQFFGPDAMNEGPAFSDGAIRSSTNLDVHAWPTFPFYFNIGSWTAVALLDDDLITIAPLTADRHVRLLHAVLGTERPDAAFVTHFHRACGQGENCRSCKGDGECQRMRFPHLRVSLFASM